MIFALLGLFKSLRGIGFFVLQFLRIASIITLMASAAGCWVLMIKVSKARSYFVFECISLFVTSIIAIVLIVSELPMLKSMRNYFRNTWPVLSDSHGVGWLGLAMIVIGCNILGALNQPAYDHHKLGDHFSSLVIAAGILSLTFGFLNILGSIIWRDGKEGITSRDIRAHGSLAKNRQSLPSYNASPASSIRNEKTRSKFVSMFWKKGDAGKPFDRPIISGPFQAHQDIERNEVEPDRTSPIAPGVQRPPTAMHPMHTGRSSHYSTANMSRF